MPQLRIYNPQDDSLRYMKDNEAGPYCDACLKRWLIRDGNVKIVIDAEIAGLAQERLGLKQRKKKKYYYKTVSLGVQPDAPCVVFKFEKAKIFFSREKVLDSFYKKIQEEPLNSRKEKMLMVYNRLKQKEEDVFYVNGVVNSKRTNNEIDDYWCLNSIMYNLLKQGKAKLYNEDKNCFEKEFKLKVIDCITGEKIESFYFSDGTEFCSRYYDYVDFDKVRGFLRLF